MNVRLLNQVVEYAEDEPKRFNMAQWYQDVSAVTKDKDTDNLEWMSRRLTACGVITDVGPRDVPACGSVSCIAGTVCILTGAAPVLSTERFDGTAIVRYGTPAGGWMETAQEKLDITELQAERLFYPTPAYHGSYSPDREKRCWPEPYRSEYLAAKTPKERVAALRRRVAAFIESNGKI